MMHDEEATGEEAPVPREYSMETVKALAREYGISDGEMIKLLAKQGFTVLPDDG